MAIIDELGTRPAAWVSGDGEEAEIVLSSRVRLARNIAGHLYPQRADLEQNQSVVDLLGSAVTKCGIGETGEFVSADEVDDLSGEILVERHLISREFLHYDRPRGLYVSANEAASVMVNEEDHVRIQAVASGMDIRQAMAQVAEVDGQLGEVLEFDTDPRLGFLTSCPTNVGTGMRASVLIHLPGLVLTEDMDSVLQQVSKIGLTVRGFHGEGSDVRGNLFQISNQTTLGRSEEDLIESLERIAKQLIAFELDARRKLFADAPYLIEDKIWRSLGMLSLARVLTSAEALNLLSAVRLGVTNDLINGLDLATLNELLLSTQPAHLQRAMKRRMSSEDRDVARAKLVRERLWPILQEMKPNSEPTDTSNDKSDTPDEKS